MSTTKMRITMETISETGEVKKHFTQDYSIENVKYSMNRDLRPAYGRGAFSGPTHYEEGGNSIKIEATESFPWRPMPTEEQA